MVSLTSGGQAHSSGHNVRLDARFPRRGYPEEVEEEEEVEEKEGWGGVGGRGGARGGRRVKGGDG